MPKFRFAVRSKEGKLRTGSVTEASLEAARERLKGAGFVIVSLQEEAELVVLESKTTSGVSRPKAERAAIIEFETTLGERIGNFFRTYILRIQFAALLLAVGAALAVYQNLNRPKPAPPAEEKFLSMKVEIQVDAGALAGKGATYDAVLPDIPLRFSRPVSEGSVLAYEFEALKQPGRVQVALLDKDNAVLAEGEGLLSIRQQGLLAGSVPLTAVKKVP
jgi:hypothetical protein